MKLVIFGGREFTNYQLLKSVLENTKTYQEGKITHVICGMARGADMLGKIWAEEKGYPVIQMPADWKQYGKAAGHIRNEAMIKVADGAIGFWEPSSHRGTDDMVEQCKAHYLPYMLVK